MSPLASPPVCSDPNSEQLAVRKTKKSALAPREYWRVQKALSKFQRFASMDLEVSDPRSRQDGLIKRAEPRQKLESEFEPDIVWRTTPVIDDGRDRAIQQILLEVC